MVAADRAARVALEPHLGERGLERVEQQQSADQRVANSQQQLDRLVGLDRADDAGQDAEHAALGAARSKLRRRGRRKEAAVAGADLRLEDRDLAFEAEDRAVHDGDVVPHRRVVDEVARGEVVGAVDDDIPAGTDDALDVVGGQPLLVRDHCDIRVERLDRLLRREHLRLAESVG